MPNFAEILAGHPGLRPGVSEAELQAFEQRHDFMLPPVLREFYLYTNGLDFFVDGALSWELERLFNAPNGSWLELWCADEILRVQLIGPLQDYVWLTDCYNRTLNRYIFRNMATFLAALPQGGEVDWDSLPKELDAQGNLPHETAYAKQLFTQWLQPDDDWQYLLGNLPYQRTTDLCVALQFATESQLKEQLHLKFDADPTVRGEFANRLSRLSTPWAQEFLATWRLELTDYEEELRAFSEQCAAVLLAAGIPAHAKWKKVFLEGRAEPLDIQAVFPRRHELGFFDELIKHSQETL